MSILVLLLLVVSCRSAEKPANETDTGTGAESDTDADMDTDTAIDTHMDVDADTDADECTVRGAEYLCMTDYECLVALGQRVQLISCPDPVEVCCKTQPLGPSDTDVNIDTDMETDTYADIGGDTDTDSEPDPNHDLSIMPDTGGWIDATSNDLGIQGSWYSAMSDGSTVSPEPETAFTNDGESLCAEGEAAEVREGDDGEPDWSNYWGILIGFDLCANSSDDDPPDARYTLSTCPFNPKLADEFLGAIPINSKSLCFSA